jgi:tripartite-type tricarboxylate transporter receptor subunit TctC
MMSALPAMRKSPPFDPTTAFTAIGKVGTFSYFLFVHPSVPAKNVGVLIDYILANPGKVNYASGNSTGILAAAQFASFAKLDMVRVPYKSEVPATIDLVSGNVQMMFATPTNAAPHAREGRLRVLATLSPQRSTLMPEVPTMVESGAPKLSITTWSGMFGPPKLPPEIVARINRELNKILGRADIREQCARQGVEVQGSTPEELAFHTREQLEVWKAGAREFGIAAE